MSDHDNSESAYKRKLKESFEHFDKLVTVCLLAGILIVSGFIVYYVLNPEPPFTTFTILNEEKEMGNYPTNATIGKNISFYVGIGNYLEREATFAVNISKGNNETTLGPNGAENAEYNFTTPNITLEHNEEWISEQLNISFYIPGNRTIIVELFEVISPSKSIFLNILFLRINVTAS
ncbi:MAG: hypothetical protein BAJALOKI3v1_810012 [Promethearchaeota archaeon]|nr:MAG: hypothetical protein BAJALOKI3v1_810012 [Candidatus Lokiarchaeota archaeon]